MKGAVSSLGNPLFHEAIPSGKPCSRPWADLWEAGLGESRRENTRSPMVLWASELNIATASSRKAPNSFRNKSFPSKVLRSKAHFEMGLRGRGGRREKLQSGRSGGFQLLGKGGWSGRQGDRGAAGPTSGPVPNVTASVLPSDAHRTVRTEDDNQGSGRRGWAFQRFCCGAEEGSPCPTLFVGPGTPWASGPQGWGPVLPRFSQRESSAGPLAWFLTEWPRTG